VLGCRGLDAPGLENGRQPHLSVIVVLADSRLFYRSGSLAQRPVVRADLPTSLPIVPLMHRTTEPLRADKNLGNYKFFSSLVLFSLIALLIIAPFLFLDLSVLVLCIIGIGGTFMTLRAVNMVRLAYGIWAATKRYARRPDADTAPTLKWRHVIVIPIYKETVDTIGRTVGILSCHRSAARNFVVLCAHEKTDPIHEEKFHRIHDEFAHAFLGFFKSLHEISPRECPGKAANVNCAVRHYAATQPRESFATTMVTVIDCDTLIDESYFYELERLASTVEDPHAVVLAAPAFFESNRSEVPCFVRAMDDLWSMGAAANIFSNSKLGFPISNYSLSLKMLEAMDYWDVDYDSVGEDFHTFVKASVTLPENVRLLPIGVPMNNENVEGHTYKTSLLARYSQSMRHALGISSTSYLLRHVLASSFSLRKSLLLLLCLESHSLPLLYFAAGFHIVECTLLGSFRSYFHDGKFELFAVLTIVSAVMGNFCYFAYKLLQYYVRHAVFRRPRNLSAELYSDASDFGVQSVCGFTYFIVPFGFRMFQNLVFWTNKGYYNKYEEIARKY